MRLVHTAFWMAVSSVVASMFLIADVYGETRTWTAAAGGFTVDAEFVELVGTNTVRLKVAGGESRDVPLDKLSTADQQYVRSRITPAGAEKDRLARIEREAGRCRSAQDALRIYKVFAASPDITDGDRAAAAAKIAELEPVAEQGLYRVAGKWVTEEEATAVRKRANELMRQGMEVLKLGQEDTFRKKFAEAGALEPEEIRGDFILAVMYSTSNRNKNNTRAVQYYQSCLKRDPTNIGVLNNLALMFVKTGDYNGALQLWKQAMAITPDQRVCHNIGKLVKLGSGNGLPVSKGILDPLTELYLSNIGDGKLKPTDPARGWLHLLTDDAGLDLDLDKTTAKATVVPPASDDGPVVGGGSGFIVDAHHIVTNAHVVEGGTAFEIQLGHKSQTETFKATVVATSKKPDLALLHCEQVLSSPVTLDPNPCRRGTDIMVLGYPEMFELGATLKATRGVISGLPSPAFDDLYLYDAVTNGGNSGGPVFDNKGNVVAAHCVGVNTASRYGGGIPADKVLTFLQKSLPTYRQQEPATKPLDWTAVDEKVSPATVLVWVRKRDGAVPTTVVAGTLEDKSCLACRGLGVTKCLNGGCVNGAMSVRVGGGSVKARCPICKGSGEFPCLHCEGQGVDRDVLAATGGAGAGAAGGAGVGGGKVGAAGGGFVGRIDISGDGPYEHPPLSPRLSERIAAAVTTGEFDIQMLPANSDDKLRSITQDGGVVVGLDVATTMIEKFEYICAVRPIFLSPNGKVEGAWIGKPRAKVKHLEAKPGYAISAFTIAQGRAVVRQIMGNTNDMLVNSLRTTNGEPTGTSNSSPIQGGEVVSSKSNRDYLIGIAATMGKVGEVDVLNGFGVVSARFFIPVRVVGTGPNAAEPPPATFTMKQGSTAVPSDQNYRQIALNGELANYIKATIAAGGAVATDEGVDRNGRNIYREMPQAGVLIGFDVSYGVFVTTPVITGIRPIFITTKGKAFGAMLGIESDNVTHIEAKTGYAISRIQFRCGLCLEHVNVTYSKLTATGLDVKDTYEGACYGSGKPGGEPVAGGTKGELIVGVVGTLGPTGARDMSAITIPAMPKKP